MFADDTHLTYIADNNVNSAESCVNEVLLKTLNVYTWLNANKLTLNVTKNEFIRKGSVQRLNTLTAFPSVAMNGSRVKQVTTTKNTWCDNDKLG